MSDNTDSEPTNDRSIITTKKLLDILYRQVKIDPITNDWYIQHPAGRYVGLTKRKPTMLFTDIAYDKYEKVQHEITEEAYILCILRELKQGLANPEHQLPFKYAFKVTSINRQPGRCDIEVSIINLY